MNETQGPQIWVTVGRNGTGTYAETQTLFSFIVAWISLTLCVFGLFSNLISVIIYSHPMMRSPINTLLAGLSIIDFSLCLLAVGAFCTPGIAQYYESYDLQDYMAVYVYGFTMVAQTSSIFAFVVISFERFVAVCWPFRARWCTIGRSLRALTAVGILYNLPRFFEYQIVVVKDSKVTTVFAKPLLRNATAHPTYMTLYYCGGYLLTHFAIPFSILLIANTFMILTVCRAHRQRRLLSIQERREHKTAFMMILVVCEFVCCNTLPFVLNIVEILDPDFFLDEDTNPLAWALNDINNLLVIFNASTTAVIYASCSEKYRRLLLMFWMKVYPFSYKAIGGRVAYSGAICSGFQLEHLGNHRLTRVKTLRRANKSHLPVTLAREPLIRDDFTLSHLHEERASDSMEYRKSSNDTFVSAQDLCVVSTIPIKDSVSPNSASFVT